MNENTVAFFVGVICGAAIICAICGIANLPDNSLPMPVSGRVLDKIELATGYNHTIYALRLELAEDRYTYIAVSAKIWHVALVGIVYDFEVGNGEKYTDIVEAVRE